MTWPHRCEEGVAQQLSENPSIVPAGLRKSLYSSTLLLKNRSRRR